MKTKSYRDRRRLNELHADTDEDKDEWQGKGRHEEKKKKKLKEERKRVMAAASCPSMLLPPFELLLFFLYLFHELKKKTNG